MSENNGGEYDVGGGVQVGGGLFCFFSWGGATRRGTFLCAEGLASAWWGKGPTAANTAIIISAQGGLTGLSQVGTREPIRSPRGTASKVWGGGEPAHGSAVWGAAR